MGLTLATSAVVLRAWPYGESDKVVCFFTESFGKLKGIAKGAKRSRKRFANSLEPFSVVNLHWQERPHAELAFLLSADLIFTFKKLDSSLEKITLAAYLVEIVDGLLGERDANPPVFHHLKNGLQSINDGAMAPLQFLTAFELELLRLVGYQPTVDSCKRCGLFHNAPKASWHFSPGEGGLLCGRCATGRESLHIGPAALLVLQDLQRVDDRRIGCEQNCISVPVLMEIRSIMQRLLQFYMEREIRSAAFLSKFVAP
jgi:DNA repair protein RecO (recombination protein O)